MRPGKESIGNFIHGACGELDFCAVSVLNLNHDSYAGLAGRLNDIYSSDSPNFNEWPEYLKKSSGKRADPKNAFPWAKSLAIFAFPFHRIPVNRNFLPETTEDDLSGLVAGYAGRIDYHVFMEEQIAKFAVELKKLTGREIRTEICVDTKPIAEKSLAAFSGIGVIGLNSCILCKGEGSGTCLGVLALDIELPELEKPDFAAPCSTCGKCVEKCPTGAITGRPGEFKYRKCRSYLTMEKKGVLEKDECLMLGDWIFGCDICTSFCPGSHPLKPVKADLEWLLLENESIIRDVIKNTPLEYPGVKLLRRNALAVLGNRKSAIGKSLLAKVNIH